MSTITAAPVASFWPRLRGVRVAELFVLLFFCLVMALPIVFMLAGSFNTAAPGQPWSWGVDNWVRAFSDPQTLSSLWMSFLFSVVRLIRSLTLWVIVGWLLARAELAGDRRLQRWPLRAVRIATRV